MYYPRHKKCKIYQAYLHQSMWTAKKFKEHIVSSNLSRQKKKELKSVISSYHLKQIIKERGGNGIIFCN